MTFAQHIWQSKWHGVAGIVYSTLIKGEWSFPLGLTAHQGYEVWQHYSNEESAKKTAVDALCFVLGSLAGETCS